VASSKKWVRIEFCCIHSFWEIVQTIQKGIVTVITDLW